MIGREYLENHAAEDAYTCLVKVQRETSVFFQENLVEKGEENPRKTGAQEQEGAGYAFAGIQTGYAAHI